MSIFDKLLKKKDVEPIPESDFSEPESSLPEDLEQFRVSRPSPVPRAMEKEFTTTRFPEERPVEREEPKGRDYDKMDMILQKLETIDARLKLLEERLSR